MPMNPVAEYAVEHQPAARAMLLSRGIPPDDLDDIYQFALMRVLVANLKHSKSPAAYWYKTLRTAIADHWRRHSRQPLPFNHGCDGEMARDREDPRQDLDRQIEVLEALHQVEDICREARPKERDAVAARLRGEPLDNAQRQRLHRLRKRLREADISYFHEHS